MANVRLFFDEIEADALPRACLRCGKPATVFKEKTFSWGPGWVMALLAVGAIASGPLFVVALVLIPVLLRRKRFRVPLCEAHRNPWRGLQAVLFGGLATLALLIFATVVLWAVGRAQRPPDTGLAGWSCLGAFVFFIVWLFPAAVVQTRVIRAIEITSNSIMLTNVGRAFVLALKEGPPAPADDRRRKAKKGEDEGRFQREDHRG
jgi:hypothetical protein